MYIIYNNEIIESQQFNIDADSPALAYGYGVFETIRVLDGRLLFWNEHIERLRASCVLLHMDYLLENSLLLENAYKLMKLNGIKNGSLRLDCLKESTNCAVTMKTRSKVYPQVSYEKGFKLCLSDIRRNEYSPLSRVKSINYLDNILAKRTADEAGYDEALLLNSSGFVSEGSISNIFWLKGNNLYTPSVECGVLPGITRKQVLELSSSLNICIDEGFYSPEKLFKADEVFITNSLMGIMPVKQIDGNVYELKSDGITSMLDNEYRKMIESLVTSNWEQRTGVRGH
ncbi:MAG: aminotransferase class IV [Bacillota bacterium]